MNTKDLFETTYEKDFLRRDLGDEMKYSKQDARLLEAKFKYANVLLGLAMLHDDDEQAGQEKDDSPVFKIRYGEFQKQSPQFYFP